MPSLILVDKSGKLKSIKTDGLDLEALCKKCGFKSIDGFALAHTWSVAFNEIEYKLCLYGKTAGRANSENKYEFPPPMDNTLFFGSCVVLNIENGIVADLSVENFEDIMEHLYGGFEDVDSEDAETESSDDEVVGLPKTKDGYVKDDFVVDSDDEDEGDDDDSEEDVESDESEEEIVKPKAKGKVLAQAQAQAPTKTKPIQKPKAAKKEKPEPILVECSDELTEEEYLV
jgi:hypothetical protein